MKFMNGYDIVRAQRDFGNDTNGATPNRATAAATIARLADWADANSDGWAYWPKPARAAAKLMALVESTTYAENETRRATDATDAELKAALAVIKGFLTREGVDYATRQYILTGRG